MHPPTLDDWWKEPTPWTDWLGNHNEQTATAQDHHEQHVRSLGPTNAIHLAAARGHPRTLP